MIHLWELIIRSLTLDGKEFFAVPWTIIRKKVFNDKMIQMLRHEMKYPLDLPTNDVEKVILKKILGINTDLVLGKEQSQFNQDSLILAIVNNNFGMIQKMPVIVTAQILGLVLEVGNEEMFFFLKKLCRENITIYHYKKAILGGSLNLVKEVGQNIMHTDGELELALQTNNTEIIKWMLLDNKKPLPEQFVKYLILNANTELLDLCKPKLSSILYHSALLSGSWEMITLISPYIDDELDHARSNGGHRSVLTDESTYVKNDKIYFSHTINYAVQSKSLDIVKHVNGQGFQVTTSNLLTCIRQGTVEQLEYLLFYGELQPYHLLYLSCHTINDEKREFAKILMKTKIFDELDRKDRSKLEIHWKIVNQDQQLPDTGTIDPDFFFYRKLINKYDNCVDVHRIERKRWRLMLGLDVVLPEQIDNIDYLFASLQILKFNSSHSSYAGCNHSSHASCKLPDKWVQNIILLLGNIPCLAYMVKLGMKIDSLTDHPLVRKLILEK